MVSFIRNLFVAVATDSPVIIVPEVISQERGTLPGVPTSFIILTLYGVVLMELSRHRRSALLLAASSKSNVEDFSLALGQFDCIESLG